MTGTSIAASGIVLEPLTKDNYENWSCLVRNYLVGHGLWGVVTSIPEIGARSKIEYEIWNRKNGKALHIIQLTCGPENLTHIRDLHIAKEAWNKLGATYSSDLQADPDIEQGVVDDSLRQYKSLHKYIESGEWKDANSFIKSDSTAIYSTSSMGRTVLHVAVVAGHEEIVKKLVKEGKDKLVKMKDNRGYTALALVAELTGNTNIAKCMTTVVYRKISRSETVNPFRDLLSMKTNDGEIPVLLAAAKGHKEMTRYLYRYTPTEDLRDDNYHNGVLLLTRCITAEIFSVALNLLQQFPKMPLAHKSHFESDCVQPLYALARMPSVFPSGSGYGFIRQFFNDILRFPEKEVREFSGIIVSRANIAKEETQHKASFVGRLCGRMLNLSPVKQLGRLLILVHMSFQNWVLLKFSGIRKIYNQKMTYRLALEILSCLHQRIQEFKESELREASAYDAMLQAAKHGIIEFIDAMRKGNPDLLWAIDKNKRGVFSHAILNRRKAVFELIHDSTVNGRKEIVKCRVDAFGNSMLHLAGYLGPSSDLDRRSGPAMQMQREILWFKAVEEIVHPKCKEAKNADDKKPRELFTEGHKELVKAGEKWAKDTAGSFTLVATLITTIMFAAAFTVPGGNNQDNGVPLFLHDITFDAFIIADAASLFTSSTSVLLFIGILTARYAEKDFLKSLPLRLLFALIMLFFSVISMIVAFCASLAMLLKGHHRVIITAMSFASVPVIVLVPSQLRLFLEIFKSTVLSN
ncbi:putative ankyrin repeat-containing domain, PGG domain-containing protein [Medicago truncatula]|uniref:Putative ankyrin repeat-containing domain, PGG domain-containing protein n=1 Tax=Medicago truncatula TaxID=3880 RepID=A0A396HN66_MEDTR|nr:uncharacterized protein LOC112421788 [Medicago truncatula]XP_039690104.1 uncharacterized protein LOC112421788 [Medicago truncatula]RHN54759.1 putative ankyrin repeat-containing domain, PGG domain-containing protein [Medicago truncatula]